ncbi:MAG TPA: TIGR02206 family membrane protein [Solirubrobacteraceae bacterium]
MRQFSVEHLAALGVLVAASALAIWLARRDRATTALAILLSAVILAGWVGEQVADVVDGIWSVKYTLPLQLTDVVSITAIVALWWPRPLLVELTYFWALTASLQATLTPDLARTFPSAFYFTYFAYHVGAIVTALMLVFGREIYPRPGATGRVFGATLVVAAVAGAADLITGGNYMYLREKPVHASLLSVMGSWPWYILETAVLAIAMLLVLEALTRALARRYGS